MLTELSQGSVLESTAPQFKTDASWLDVLPEACNELRPYQRGQIAEIGTAMHEGRQRILVQLATGGGKSHEIAAIVLAAWTAGLRVLLLATRTRLVRQLHERLDAFGVPHGVIAAPLRHLANYAQRVQVASADTLYRRCIVDQRSPLPAADVVIFDEAHLALGASRTAILERFPAAWLFGFTATPAKVSGRPLSDLFGRLILGPPMRELIAMEMLVRPRIFNQPVLTKDELRKISRDAKTDDFRNAELGEVMAKPKLVGDVVENWLRIANGKRTIVFAVNKSHGQQLTEEFRRAGVAAELLTDDDSEPAREEAIARLERGETKVICNCFLMAYGVDIPSVEAVVLARPTRSLVLYLQMLGRGMRPAQGKGHVVVIDHGRIVESMGLPTEDFGWSLSGGNVNRQAREAHGTARISAAEKSRECPECHHLWLVSEEGNACSHCGWQPAPRAKPVTTQTAELHELNTRAAQVTVLSDAVVEFYREAIGYYAQKHPDRWRQTPNKGRGFAWQKTRDRFELKDEKPPSSFWTKQPLRPSGRTYGWIKSREIAYYKAMAGRRQQEEQLGLDVHRQLDQKFRTAMEMQP